MAFKEKFTDQQFLNMLDTEIPTTTTVVARYVGCSRNSAKTYLDRLLLAGKVQKVEINGGFFAWVLVDADVNEEPVYEPTFIDVIQDYIFKHPDDELAKKTLEMIAPNKHPFKLGDHIVWDNITWREDLKEEIGYTGAIVMQVTEVYRDRIWAIPVGAVQQRTKTKCPISPDKARLATSEEIRIAKNAKIPKQKKVKEIED
jgi:hypothetical protein